MSRERFSAEERALLARLAAAFAQQDPVPAAVCHAAELAGSAIQPRGSRWLPLLRDTALVPRTLALRGLEGSRVLSFGDAQGAIDIELESDGSDHVRLTGLLSASLYGAQVAPLSVSVKWQGNGLLVPVDETGRFAAAKLPAGPLTMTVFSDAELIASTAWFLG